MVLVLGRLANRQVAAAFLQWAAVARAAADAVANASRAICTFLNRTLSLAWRTWLATNALRTHALALIRRVAQREVYLCLAQWRAVAGATIRQLDELGRAVGFMRHAELGRVVDDGGSPAARRGDGRSTRRADLMHRTSRPTSGSCARPPSAAEEDTLRAVLLTFGAKLDCGWRCAARAGGARERAFFYRLVGKVDEAGERKDAKSARMRHAEKAVHRLFELQCSRAFDTWLEYAEARGHALGQLTSAVRQLRQVKVGRALRAWVDFAELRMNASYLLRRVAQGKLYAALSTWSALATDRAEAFATADRVIRRFLSQRLSKGFETFVAYCAEAAATLHALQVVVGRLRNRNLARALLQWQAAHAHKRATLHAVGATFARTEAKYMRAGLKCWRMGKVLVKRHREALHYWQYVLASGEFEKARQMALLEKACRRLVQLKLAKYFTTLTYSLWMERTMATALRRLEMHAVSRGLLRWKERAFDEIDEVSAYERAFRRLRHLSTGKAFAQWVEHVTDRIHALATLQDSLREMRITIFGWALPRWTGYVGYLKALQRAVARLRARDLGARPRHVGGVRAGQGAGADARASSARSRWARPRRPSAAGSRRSRRSPSGASSAAAWWARPHGRPRRPSAAGSR